MTGSRSASASLMWDATERVTNAVEESASEATPTG